ncbi:hypothetical protein R5R35_008377 [Gryllus longicercus]|uniref:Single domain-containing protein n=1 Tax=Gryllus longicercus TaxID=2509291 RepID=A0AAN9Z7G5_9ORTH
MAPSGPRALLRLAALALALAVALAAALAASEAQLETAPPGSCVLENGTLPEGASAPDPGGACVLLLCSRDRAGNLALNVLTCSNIPLQSDIERESNIYPLCCPYPDIEKSE